MLRGAVSRATFGTARDFGAHVVVRFLKIHRTSRPTAARSTTKPVFLLAPTTWFSPLKTRTVFGLIEFFNATDRAG
ncbi:MAG: hypothetical protein IJK97_10305, partial [Thermoguttaceae bacterium]|nr:hypothetical protein [Thermoguttaceae bacterium]